ncbi:MAG TPA: BMC domain-containing protein [Elusimicrobiota bacterium]|nr:BMC domain-containing protein [Elusimicrobiota bacterium]
MNSNDLTNTKPSVGFLETNSIAQGVLASDAMMKMADVELLMTAVVARGKYLIMIAGVLADVQQSMKAGLETAGGAVVDHFIIQNIHPQLLEAVRGRVKVSEIEAVGLIETKEIASAIYAADAAAKAAAITLIEARHQGGGKGLVVLTGEVGAVRSAIAAGTATIQKSGMLVSQVVIPYAHKALLRSLTGTL